MGSQILILPLCFIFTVLVFLMLNKCHNALNIHFYDYVNHLAELCEMREKGRKINKFPIQEVAPLVRRNEHHPRRDEGVRCNEGTLRRSEGIRCNEGTLCCDEPEELKDVGYRFVTTKRQDMSNILTGSSQRSVEPNNGNSTILT